MNPALLALEVDERLRPPWFSGSRSGPILFPCVYKNAVEGETLVSFIRGQDKFPAIVRQAGQLVFNFDPEATIQFLLNEEYLVPGRPLSRFLPVHYHLVPARLRMLAKRLSVSAAKKTAQKGGFEFPSWPLESAVETVRHIAAGCRRLAGQADTKPRFSWPQGRKFALILSHDIDTNEGFSNIDKFSEIESRHHCRSCWFVVARLFAEHKKQLAGLLDNGFEIGCHDYSHDNRLTSLPAERMKQRLAKCSRMLKEFSVCGFRSPSLLRSRPMFEAVEDFFLYDSSVPDTEVFLQTAPRSGCCSVFPYAASGGLIELPITLPLDSTLLALGLGPERIYEFWKEKLGWIKKLGGIAHIDTHAESHYCGNTAMLKAYEKFLDFACADAECWIARPREAALWWQKYG